MWSVKRSLQCPTYPLTSWYYTVLTEHKLSTASQPTHAHSPQHHSARLNSSALVLLLYVIKHIIITVIPCCSSITPLFPHKGKGSREDGRWKDQIIVERESRMVH